MTSNGTTNETMSSNVHADPFNTPSQDHPKAIKAKPKLMTICFLVKGSQVLLSYKKRGFGADRWNGFGGKVHDGETIEQAAIREMLEEAGVHVRGIDHRGTITFEFIGKPQPLEVHIFMASSFTGEPAESEEMRPKWFDISTVPFDQMWVDDKYWLPHLLTGKRVKGRFVFADETTVIDKDLQFF